MRNCRCCAIICCDLIRKASRDRFNGFMDDSFIERYAAKCAGDGTIIVAYMEHGMCVAQPNCIRRETRTNCLKSLSASSRACGEEASAVSCSTADLGSAVEGLSHLTHHDRRAEPRHAGAGRQIRGASELPPWRGPAERSTWNNIRSRTPPSSRSKRRWPLRARSWIYTARAGSCFRKCRDREARPSRRARKPRYGAAPGFRSRYGLRIFVPPAVRPLPNAARLAHP